MNISVTGGTGFIGRRLVEALGYQGYGVKILSRQPGAEPLPGMQIISGDLVSADCPIAQFVEGSEIIFHCAGEISDHAKMRLLHIEATRRLLDAVHDEASKNKRTIHWVQLSSVGAYGPPAAGAGSDRIVTEETPTNPVGEYETTKTVADELVTKACQDGLITYSIVRPSNVFGRNMPNQALRALGDMIGRRLFFYIGKPGTVANYVHVDDVIAVLLRCGFDSRAQGQIFNLSNDCMLVDLVHGIAQELGVTPPRLRLPELLVRLAVSLASKLATIPLTRERINALVSRTRYPCDKLESMLDIKPEKPVPATIGEALLSE